MLNTKEIASNVINLNADISAESLQKLTKSNIEKQKKAEKKKEMDEAFMTFFEKQEKFLEKHNINNIIPEDYLVCGSGVYLVIRNNEGDIKEFSNISGTPIFIDSIETDYDTHNEKVILSFFMRNRLHKEVFNAEDLANKTTIIKEFASKGISIDSKSATEMTVFIRKLKDRNCNKEEDNHIVLNSIGWKNKGQFFSYPTPADKEVLIGDIQSGEYTYSEDIIDKFMQANNTTEYRNKFLEIFDKNIYSKLSCLTSLAGPFLQKMGAPNIMLYFYGNSSSAKTAIMRFAQSAWYDSEKNAMTFNSTSIALDNKLALYSGTTLLIDERQSLGGDRKMQERNLTQFIYSAVNGTGRARAQKNQDINNGLRKIQNYHLSIMATGEEKILGDDSKSGAQNRILEIPVNGQILSHDEARKIYNLIKFSYGGLGVEFLKKSLDLIEKENIDLFEKNYRLQDAIAKKTEGDEKSERQIGSLTILAIVDYLLRRTIFCDDEAKAVKHMNKFINETLEYLMSKDKTDETTKSKNLIDDFCSEYSNYILDATTALGHGCTKVYGYKTIDGNKTTYYLIYNALKSYTDSKDESILKMLKNLSDNDYVRKFRGSYRVPKKFRNTDISGSFVIYTTDSTDIEEADIGVETHEEEIAEINAKIDEKHNVVREQPKQDTFVDMQADAQNTTVNDLFPDDDRPW